MAPQIETDSCLADDENHCRRRVGSHVWAAAEHLADESLVELRVGGSNVLPATK